METLKLRKKLIQQFDPIIKDDEKLVALEGVFDALNTDETISKIPLEHYKKIDEAREKHLKGESESKTWDEVKEIIKSKYRL